MLYIPELPSLRAQSIQVVSSAHALARRGRRVRLWYRATGADPLAPYGLASHPRLELCALPPSKTLASVCFRADILRWARVHRGRGVFLARSKRYARYALKRAPQIPLVMEAHEVDSIQRARTDGASLAVLESEVLGGAAALIANCEGVMEGLSWMHRLPENRRVVHNAWLPGAPPTGPGSGVALAGSLLEGKDPSTVARAGRELGGVTVYGPSEVRWEGLVWGGSVAPRDLVAVLQQHAVLVLPLGRGWFGERFTSPLKAFSYAATGRPIVGADTPALRAALGSAFEPYQPGDPGSLVAAVRRVLGGEARPAPPQRTWDQRAAEVDEVLDAIR